MAEARAALEQAKPLGITLIVEPAAFSFVDVNVTITPAAGYSFDEVRPRVETAIREFLLSLGVGRALKLSELGRVLMETEGVDNYAFVSMQDVTVSGTAMVRLDSLTITQG